MNQFIIQLLVLKIPVMLSTFVLISKNQVLAVRNLVSSSVTAARGKDMIEMYVAIFLKLIVKYWTSGLGTGVAKFTLCYVYHQVH